jgi:hypothetical protein
LLFDYYGVIEEHDEHYYVLWIKESAAEGIVCQKEKKEKRISRCVRSVKMTSAHAAITHHAPSGTSVLLYAQCVVAALS